MSNSEKRAPLARHTQSKNGKRDAGATDGPHTPIEIRDLDGAANDRLRAWVHGRLGRQLGKFAPQIERIDVRFDDVNGSKGGFDRSCMVHVVLSALPPVVVEILGENDQEAFDQAAARAERATRRTLEKHGFSTGHKRRNRGAKGAELEASMASDGAESGDTGSDGAATDNDVGASELGEHEPLFGKRAGHGPDQLMLLQQKAGKVRGDLASDGVQHTGRRNVKLNTAGMSYALEDSTDGKPSRKSSRRSANRSKPANGLTLRTKSSVLSPKSIAARSESRGR